MITAAQLQQVLSRQVTDGESRIAGEVLGLGFAHEAQLAQALAGSTGSPALVFSASTLDLAPLGVVPRGIAEQHTILPVAMDDETVTVAAADVDSRPIFEQVSFVTGRRVTAVLAVDALLQKMIPEAYDAAARGEKVQRGDKSPHEGPHLELARDVIDNETEAVEFVKSLSGGTGFGERSGEYSVTNPDPTPITSTQTPLEHLTSDFSVPSGTAIASLQLKRMEVPVMPTPTTSGPAPEAPAPQTGERVVFVIEDDDAIRTLIEKAMQHDGYTVHTAATGDAGAELLRNAKPHLIILDAMLPGMHGFEICARVKNAEMFRDVAVVMISAVYRGWEQAREIQEVHGADMFLEKPFDVHYLRKIAADFLGEQLERVQLPPDRAQQVLALRHAAGDLSAQGHWQDALGRIHEWLTLDPFDPLAHLEAGNLRSQMRDYEGAMRCYEAAVVYDKGLFPALTNLALVYERLGFRRKAIQSWRLAAGAAPDPGARSTIEARVLSML